MSATNTKQPHGFEYDVFVSYAQANDHDGWVTRFKDKLTDFLNERLEWTPRFFWDEQSIGINDDLDTKITESVRNSAVMVVVVSHKYLTRQWCALERETFLQDGNERRVMIVRYDDVAFQDFQQVLPKCLGIEFFDNDGLPLEVESREFKKRLHKLRETIVDEIEALQQVSDAKQAGVTVANEVASQTTSSPSVSERPRAFIAPVPPASTEMISRRDELISFLDDCDIDTVTPADYFFMRPDFDAAITVDLDRCHGFVQLLDVSPFPPPPNMAEGVERWFLDLAREGTQHATLFLWRLATPTPENACFAAPQRASYSQPADQDRPTWSISMKVVRRLQYHYLKLG